MVGTAVEFELSLGLDQLFEDIMPESLSLDQLPGRFAVGDRTLELQGRVIRDDSGDPDGVLFTISDSSALLAAQREARSHAVVVSILRQKAAFTAFVRDTTSRLDAAQDALSDTIFVRRAVHTIKGNAGSYGLDDVASVAHHVEAADTIDQAGLDHIRAALAAFLSAHQDVLGISSSDQGRTIEIDERQLETLRTIASAGDTEGVQSWSRQVALCPVGELLGPVHGFVERLAERLDKQVDFTLEGGDTLVCSQVFQPVLSNLSHLIRNALAHGLEQAWERGDKPEQGSLVLAVAQTPDGWTLSLSDDGRGVQVDTIVEAAVQSGVMSEEQAAVLDQDARLNLVFVDGFSSRAEATAISGRGVGMSAVRATVHGQGGRLEFASEPGQGTTVTIQLPQPQVLRAAM